MTEQSTYLPEHEKWLLEIAKSLEECADGLTKLKELVEMIKDRYYHDEDKFLDEHGFLQMVIEGCEHLPRAYLKDMANGLKRIVERDF